MFSQTNQVCKSAIYYQTTSFFFAMRGRAPAVAEGGHSLAIVLHGKIGGMVPMVSDVPTASMMRVRSVEGASASSSMMALSYASLLQHVIAPNRRRGIQVDIFGHSWSPEVAGLLDALYQPTRSLHELPRSDLRCPVVDRVMLKECVRTVSHLLGIRRAIEVKMAEERERGKKFDSVYIGRWDVLWNRPLSLPSLPGWAARTANTFWLPHHCVPRSGEPARNVKLKSAVCGGSGKGWRGPPGAKECRSDHRPCGGDMSSKAREYFLLDWWTVASSSAAADTFCLGMHANHTELWDTTVKRLSRFASPTSRATPMGHTFWGLQLLDRMNASIVWSRVLVHDFTLGRMWRGDECLALRPRCLQQRRCGLDDALRRPWQSWPISEEGQWPNAVTFAGPRAENPLRYSCADNVFMCSEGSQMCADAARAAPPLDRSDARALYVVCAETLCSEFSPFRGWFTRGSMGNRTGAHCASLMLDALVSTMALAAPANASFAPRIRLDSAGSHHSTERQSVLPALKERASELLAASGQARQPLNLRCNRAIAVSSRGSVKLPSPLKFGRCDAAIKELRGNSGGLMARGTARQSDGAPSAWGNCTGGTAGGWRRSGLTSGDCDTLCDRCRHCYFVSLSIARGECLWSRECTRRRDNSRTVTENDEGYSFFSVLRKEKEQRRYEAKKERDREREREYVGGGSAGSSPKKTGGSPWSKALRSPFG